MHKSTFHETLGVLIISWIFYRTMIFIKEPYQINETVSWYMISLITIILGLHIFNLLKIWHHILIGNNKKYGLINKIIAIVYYKPLHILGESLLKHNTIVQIVRVFSKMLLSSIRKISAIYISILIYQIFPKTIIAIVLLIDVFMANEINYFYKSLWIFMIPLTYKSLLYLIQLHTESEKENLVRIARIKVLNSNNTTIELKYSQNIESMSKTEIIGVYVHCANVLDIIKAIKICEQQKIMLVLNSIYTTLSIIGWAGLIYKVMLDSLNVYKTEYLSLFLIWLIKLIIP